ncbi:MAG: hypothetical protein RJA97_75 [Bacteroidota bacterium]
MRRIQRLFHILAVLVVLVSAGCDRNEAKPVVYLEVDSLTLAPDPSRGTSSAHVRSVWVESEGTYLGVYPLPARIPLPVSDPNATVRLYPGVEVNGISSFQAQYEFYGPYTRNLNSAYGQTVKWPPGGAAVLAYESWAQIVNVEDFESAGIQFAPTPRSDTVWNRTQSERFPAPAGETHNASGMVVLRPGQNIFEAITQQAYVLPKSGQSVYLEINYKSTMPFNIGVVANENGTSTQQTTVTFRDKRVWSKAYINLVTEVSGFPGAVNYNLFLGAVRTDREVADTLWIDNLKLVYR